MKSLACCFFLRSQPLPAVVAAWAMFTGLASAEKLIIQNGSFDAGKKYWKGDGEVVTLKEDGNRVGQIEADERRLKHLSIEFEMGDLTVLEIRFRARFLGGAGRVRLKVETGSGAVMNGYDLPPDGSWKDLTMTYDRKPGIKKFYAVFQALLGKGVVQIDDVWAGAPGTAPTDPRSTVIIPAKPTTPPVKPVPMEKAVAVKPLRQGGINPQEATKEKPFENSLGMKFVPVPGANLLFCIHETRWKDYAEYAQAVPGIDSKWRNQIFGTFPPSERPGDLPVVHVSWEDAAAFCKWLSEREKKTYRLPTDREWSLAVDLGGKEQWSNSDTPESVSKDQNEFPWGTAWPPPPGVGNYSDESQKALALQPGGRFLDGYDDSFPAIAPVMSFAPNQCGLYDLGGNVWEWVEDWWSDAKSHRVSRGGSWLDGGRGNALSSARNHNPPEKRYPNTGFRPVLILHAR